MFDWKWLLSCSVLILSISVMINTMASAYAVNGPTQSLGANPVKSFYGSSNMVITLDGTQDFVIRAATASSDNCQLQIDGTTFKSHSSAYNPLWYHRSYPTNSPFANGQGLLVVPAGSSLELVNCGNWYIGGYYQHP